MFVCPSHKDWAPYPLTYGNATMPSGYDASKDKAGYGYNGAYWAVGDPPTAFDGPYDAAAKKRLDGIGLSQIVDSSKVLMAADSANGNTAGRQGADELGDCMRCGGTLGNSDPWNQGKDYYPEYRHNGGFNMVFADGHAKFRQGGRLPEGVWTIGTEAEDGKPDL